MASPVSSLDLALDRLRRFVRGSGLSPRAFAAAAGVSERATRGMFAADWSPSSSTIRRLEAVIPPQWPDPPADAAEAPSGPVAGDPSPPAFHVKHPT